MDYNAADKENVGEVLKRRSSILKTRDFDPTQNPTTTYFTTRRISFHNRLKIQEYDRVDGGFCTEQEEQLHLTSNSDEFRNLTLSESVVAGPLDNALNDMSLTLLHGPQAFSTPAVGKVPPSSNANFNTNDDEIDDGTTIRMFDVIRAAAFTHPPTADETYTVIEATAAGCRPNVADRTCAIFDVFRSAEVASKPTGQAEMTGDKSTISQSEQPEQQNDTVAGGDEMDAELGATDFVEESRWSNRFYDSGGGESASDSQAHIPPQRSVIYEGSMLTGLTEKMMQQAAAEFGDNFSDMAGSMLVPFGESLMAPTGTIDALSRSRSRRLHNNETIVKGATGLDASALREPPEDLTLCGFEGSELMDAADDDQPIGDLDCTPIAVAHPSVSVVNDITFTPTVSSSTAKPPDATYTIAQENKQPAAHQAAAGGDVSLTTIATFHKSITEDISIFGGSSPKKQRSFHRRRRSSVFVSVAGSGAASPSGQLVVKPSTLPSGLAERRKSLLIQQTDGVAAVRPPVDSPTIIVDNDDNFNDIVIEVDESELEKARQNHARKRALYELMDTTLAHVDALHAEEACLDAEMKSSFGDLLAKLQTAG